MLRSSIVRLVELCTRHAWPVIVLAVALAAFCSVYTARHFAIATDIKQLFPTELPWTQRAYEFMGTLPQHDVLVAVAAPAAESADRAAAKLTAALSADTAHFKAVQQPQGGAFFARNGLLFLPSDELRRLAGEMSGAGLLIGTLAADPSLRGALGALAQGLMGVANGAYGLDALTRPMQMAGDTVDAALHNRPAHFSWRELASGRAAKPEELRRFIEIEPVLDFNALQPGLAATQAITDAAQRLNLAGGDQARVRVTGLVPMNDAEFATLQDHAAVNGAVSIAAVLIILWLALRSSRVLNPPGELRPMGFAGLAPIDRFLQRQRVAVVGVTLAVVILASPLLAFLPFDFNPLHLQNPNSEAVATYLELRRDPQTGANAAEIIKPDLAAAEASAQRLSRL